MHLEPQDPAHEAEPAPAPAPEPNPAVLEAITLARGQTALATALGVAQPTLREWLYSQRRIPARRCVEIERATFGRVTCEQLRPDIEWKRQRDRKWPWHRRGRPLIDLAAA